MINDDIPLLTRIDMAIGSITDGEPITTHVPVDACDVDLVLLECKNEVVRLRKESVRDV